MATEVATVSKPVDIANGYISFEAKTAEDAVKLYNAVSGAESLKEHVNVPLKVKDVIIQNIQSLNDDTGVVEDRILTTLITEDGKAYASNSNTVASDIRNLLTFMGEPGTRHWVKPITLVAKSVKSTSERSFLTLTLG